MDWSVVLIIIAAAVLAINQAIKDADAVREKWPRLKLPDFFAYVPILLIAVSGALWLLQSSPAEPTKASADKPAEIAKVGEAHVPSKSNALGERDLRDTPYLSGLPFEKLIKISEEMTGVQADAAIQPYLDEDVNLAGLIMSVRSNIRGVTISLEGSAYYKQIAMMVDGNVDQYINWSQGDLVEGRCKLYSIESSLIFLKDCELKRHPKG